jgi:hypothetical protein
MSSRLKWPRDYGLAVATHPVILETVCSSSDPSMLTKQPALEEAPKRHGLSYLRANTDAMTTVTNTPSTSAIQLAVMSPSTSAPSPERADHLTLVTSESMEGLAAERFLGRQPSRRPCYGFLSPIDA